MLKVDLLDRLIQYDLGSSTMASSQVRAENLVTAQSMGMDGSAVAEPLAHVGLSKRIVLI